MIEGDRIAGVEVNSEWTAERGPGCELTVHLASERELFVIREGIASTEEEVAGWEEDRVGQEIASSKALSRWPLGTGGEQITLEIELEDGFGFHGDLILGGPDELPEEEVADEEELETEWVFEGQPGVEMGKQQGDQG